jgi:hypothetical protein
MILAPIPSRSFRLAYALVALVTLVASSASAELVSIGKMANWQALPSRSVDDKVFTWLADSGNWNGTEDLSLTSNASGDIHSLNLDDLTQYGGPFTLTVDYRIDITSNHMFKSISVDTDTLVPNTAAYKDVFSSQEKLEEAVGFGFGDLAALAAVNGVPAAALLPSLQQIWVRDTIVIDATGQLNSASNTVVQMVPEPSGVMLVGAAIVSLATWRKRRRRGQTAY